MLLEDVVEEGTELFVRRWRAREATQREAEGLNKPKPHTIPKPRPPPRAPKPVVAVTPEPEAELTGRAADAFEAGRTLAEKDRHYDAAPGGAGIESSTSVRGRLPRRRVSRELAPSTSRLSGDGLL